MSYTKRTCHSCGIKLPQPDMQRTEINYTSGQSNTGLTKRTIIGSLFGEESSTRQLKKFFFSPNKRTYQRRSEVWVCGSCNGGSSDSSNYFFDLFKVVIFLFIILIIILIIYNNISPYFE